MDEWSNLLTNTEEKDNNKEGSIEFSWHGYSYPTKRVDFPIKQIIPQKGIHSFSIIPLS